ncbi:LT_GEWL domain containing protein [uncultured Caudovirales phage]|uniref:LT_GEWL domain containing protein n=1 Tax=uncultured Caudovirales phage TaxID=2100421 RepID=A0A6J7XB06_9CAUD|nr:LT_GEWL domain containing protein [uncultured Caudovirales phage]CAB5226903.1 LT_GEWL domain containing protein [uncultured Caudovirales phage]
MITTYDATIQKFHKEYNLPYDWTLLKAQLFQESQLKPDACSPVGALGLAQFMPDTWEEYTVKCGLPANTLRNDATASIQCCAAYMRYLISQWKAKRSDVDRYNLALASYNAGLGNILKAQKMVKGANDYATIIKALKFVTGNENALQTSNYVVKINEYHTQLNRKV